MGAPGLHEKIFGDLKIVLDILKIMGIISRALGRKSAPIAI